VPDEDIGSGLARALEQDVQVGGEGDPVLRRPGAGIRVRAGALGLQDGRIEVWVDDDGPGLAPGVRDRLFEAFFTTKPPGEGTGLGLYTALSLVREAGGTLALDDRPDGGARARLVLPNGGAA
jgi:signal transduction histidine kinase